MIYFACGSIHDNLTTADLEQGLTGAFDRLCARRRVVPVPPVITRLHARAGDMACRAGWRDLLLHLQPRRRTLGVPRPVFLTMRGCARPATTKDQYHGHTFKN